MSQPKFKSASLLAGTALVAMGVVAASQASADGHAKFISSGNDKTTLKLSGHMSRQITVMDDGRTSVRHSDSNFSSSRIVIDAATKVNNDLKVGTRAEIAFDDNRNAPATAGTEFGGRSGNDLQTRKAEIHFTHSSFGKVWMGAGDTAANGITELSFVNYTMLLGGGNLQNGGAYRLAAGDADELSGATVANTMSQPDMLGRSTRVRYDTPNMMGFKASVSHLDNQTWDAAIRYSGKLFDTKIKAGLGYANGAAQENLGGSIAFQHSSGLGVTAGFESLNPEARSDTRGNDPFYQNYQLHYTAKFNEMGTTQLVYEYNHHENERSATSNETATAHSIGVHQKIDAAAMELALRFMQTELDTDAFVLDNDTVEALSLHARVKF